MARTPLGSDAAFFPPNTSTHSLAVRYSLSDWCCFLPIPTVKTTTILVFWSVTTWFWGVFFTEEKKQEEGSKISGSEWSLRKTKQVELSALIVAEQVVGASDHVASAKVDELSKKIRHEFGSRDAFHVVCLCGGVQGTGINGQLAYSGSTLTKFK